MALPESGSCSPSPLARMPMDVTDKLSHRIMFIFNNNIIVIRQFISRRNMSMKSLQGRHTPGSGDECRTEPDGRRLLDQAHGLEPLGRL